MFSALENSMPQGQKSLATGVIGNIFSLKKQLPSTCVQEISYSPVIISQEINTPGN